MAKVFNVRYQPGFRAISLFCLLSLYTPIAVLITYSFNAGNSLAEWEGFSIRWYISAWNNEAVIDAAFRSLYLAAIASTVATSVATMAALAMVRLGKFRGKGLINMLINQPLMVPEIITAMALLATFAIIKVATGYAGMGYLILAHSAFCIPFAYLPISARLQGMDSVYESAAADLYAPPWQTFRYVTFPLLWPGILAGGMLAFVVSLDDVVITEFVKSAGQETLPTYMLGQLRRIVTPEINAVATVFLAASVSLVSLFFALNRRAST